MKEEITKMIISLDCQINLLKENREELTSYQLGILHQSRLDMKMLINILKKNQ